MPDAHIRVRQSGISPGGSLEAWTQTLDGALQLDFDTAIPGPGP
jgi:hypothetical protein